MYLQVCTSTTRGFGKSAITHFSLPVLVLRQEIRSVQLWSSLQPVNWMTFKSYDTRGTSSKIVWSGIWLCSCTIISVKQVKSAAFSKLWKYLWMQICRDLEPHESLHALYVRKWQKNYLNKLFEPSVHPHDCLTFPTWQRCWIVLFEWSHIRALIGV